MKWRRLITDIEIMFFNVKAEDDVLMFDIALFLDIRWTYTGLAPGKLDNTLFMSVSLNIATPPAFLAFELSYHEQLNCSNGVINILTQMSYKINVNFLKDGFSFLLKTEVLKRLISLAPILQDNVRTFKDFTNYIE